MSVLTKKQILERITESDEKKRIEIRPGLDDFQIQAHAIDLRLGFTFLIPKQWHITNKGRQALTIDHFDKNKPDYFDIVELEQGQTFELLPGEHVLVASFESVKIPHDLMAVLYPRSSTNRKGLSVDLTGIIDSGYDGQLVIPVRNNTQSQIVTLYPGERFCQIVFDRLDEVVDAEKSRYHRKDIIEGFVRTKEEKRSRDEKEITYISQGKLKELKHEHNAIS